MSLISADDLREKQEKVKNKEVEEFISSILDDVQEYALKHPEENYYDYYTDELLSNEQESLLNDLGYKVNKDYDYSPNRLSPWEESQYLYKIYWK